MEIIHVSDTTCGIEFQIAVDVLAITNTPETQELRRKINYAIHEVAVEFFNSESMTAFRPVPMSMLVRAETLEEIQMIGGPAYGISVTTGFIWFKGHPKNILIQDYKIFVVEVFKKINGIIPNLFSVEY